MKLKLMEIEAINAILEPILVCKCRGKLAWELIDLMDDLSPEIMKIKKLKEKIVDNYAIKNEDGTYLVKINEFNQEVYDFGENAEKVDEELKEVLESEIEIDKCISMSNIDDNIEIEPINLKYLISKQIIKK